MLKETSVINSNLNNNNNQKKNKKKKNSSNNRNGDGNANAFGHVTGLNPGEGPDSCTPVLAHACMRLATLTHDALGDSKAAARLYREAATIDPASRRSACLSQLSRGNGAVERSRRSGASNNDGIDGFGHCEMDAIAG